MAYKFQLGAAILSGSLTQEGQVLAKDSAISGSSLSLAGVAVTSTAAELNVLAGVTAGAGSASKALVLDSFSDVSGINALGLASLSASAELNADSVQIGGNTILTSDGNVTAVGVSGSGAFQAGGALTVAGNADLNGILDVASHISGAGSVVLSDNNAQLLFTRGGNSDKAFITSTDNHRLTIQGSGSGLQGGITLRNGTDDRMRVRNDSVAFIDADLAIAQGLNTPTTFLNSDRSQFTLGATSNIGVTGDLDLIGLAADAATINGGLTITGDLTVQGTTVTLDVANISLTSSFVFEGSTANDFETTLTVADPTADRTITLPDLTGHVPLLAGAVSNANVTAAEFALLDGGSSVGTATVIDGDAVLFNDGGTMKHINVTSLKTYFQSNVAASSYAVNFYATGSTSNLNGVPGIWIANSQDGTGAANTQLDLSGSWSDGAIVVVKAPADTGASAQPVTIAANVGAAHSIDGANSILLESDYAAVTLVYSSATEGWHII